MRFHLFFADGTSPATFICPVFVLFGIVLFFMISRVQEKTRTEYEKKREEIVGKINLVDEIFVGWYQGGLPNTTVVDQRLTCFVSEAEFIFIVLGQRYEVGRIPRDSINEVIMDRRSHIMQRLTVTRMLTLGIFSLAVPKTSSVKEYFLMIDWNDEKGERHNTLFEFKDAAKGSSAPTAVEKFNLYKLPKVYRPNEAEKKCPFCAETIKKEAVLCRFCRSDLTIV